MARPIGLAALTALELAPPDLVSCAARAGYDHVGLRLVPATPDEVRHPIVGDTPLVRETLRRLADTGVRVFDVEVFRLTPETKVESFRGALDTAARLGAREALVAGNDADLERLVDRMAAFCALCAEFDMGASLEPMPWTSVRDFAQGARIVERTGMPNAGLLIDPIHFDRGGARVDEIARVPASRFRYVQLCDAPAERPTDTAGLLHQARAERRMPGDGDLDLAGILRALPRNIPISVEVPMRTVAQTVPALERARRLLDKTRNLLEPIA